MKTIISKNGIPTVYGFSCGYIGSIIRGQSYKRIWFENGVYFVAFKHSTDIGQHITENYKEAVNTYKAIELN